MPSPPIPVPPRWRTVSTERTLLAVVHNVTAATRLLDVLALFAVDPRIQTVFTCPGSSAFTRGTEEFLSARGIPLLPWPEAVRTEFDWALAASCGGDLHELRAPLTVIPHGMGYNKFLDHGNRKAVFGLSEPWLMHRGEVVPAHIVLSHQEQLDRLGRDCPPAVDRAVVAGDPCLDRLRASRPLRETYRQKLGVRRGQKLVLLSSTWGPESLYGHAPDLPAEIARELPLDEFRVVLALHPNIGQGHFPWQVRRWLEDGRRSGVLVLPQEQLWQPAAVAADVTIGDQGSVTFYSACLGTPVLLATAPRETVDPASPIAALLRSAPELKPGHLADQLTEAIAHPPALDAVIELATSVPGEFAARLTELGYRTLDLSRPERPPALVTFAPPRIRTAAVGAQWVSVFDGQVVRHAANGTSAPPRAHLVVTTDAPDPRLLERAGVVLGDQVPDPVRWIVATLTTLPGCSWAACPDGTSWLAGAHDGRLVRFATPELPEAVPSLLHSHHGELPAELRFTVAGVQHEVRLSVVKDGTAPPATP
ncbi:hypothetical protein [Amycolatopsis sp. PS_44_ISF1]|uniref:hypothetical protein n=1 Tax=Amycolatopsis sp. PS_44_ISF1 TaxID=2974917 RepID=UPI0028E04B97|nr:hypothetical protein [Amycolatopsis sp. PS_44_ISF1]MDT8910404.1 hypothetical protein [Amycolatopsis sp. PS_44_ISF1]